MHGELLVGGAGNLRPGQHASELCPDAKNSGIAANLYDPWQGNPASAMKVRKQSRHREGTGRSRLPARGQSAPEFAMVVTVLLMLIFGVIDMARALYAYTQ